MSHVVSTTPKGRNFVRSVIAKAVLHNSLESENFSVSRWGEHAGQQIAKSASALTTGIIDPLAREFFGLIQEQSILGRLSGLRKVPFRAKLLASQTGAGAAWVAEGQEVPVSTPSLMPSQIEPRKIRALIITTEEALNNPLAEPALQSDLQQAVISVLNTAFIDPNNAGVTETKPPSITRNAPIFIATGDIADDVETLILAFEGDLSRAYFVSDPATAIRLAQAFSGGTQLFPDSGARGGSILGIPLVVSSDVPRNANGGRLVLLDPSAIAFAQNGLVIDTAGSATVRMDDDSVLSLWQNNLVGLSCTITANWSVQRSGAVVVLEDI